MLITLYNTISILFSPHFCETIYHVNNVDNVVSKVKFENIFDRPTSDRTQCSHMNNFPKPPSVTKTDEHDERSGALTVDEWTFILDATLKPKSRKDPTILAFIDAFVRCKNIAQASEEIGIKAKVGYMIRHRLDVSNCIQRMIDKSSVKYGFDASEIMERTKEIVDFDPISVQNPDGTFKDNLHDIDPEARRNIKKLKVQNLYNTTEDMNGMKKKIIVGKVIEYEFYDKLKAIDLAGKEKEMFKNTTRVEHTVTKDMASILLEASKRGQQASVTFAPKTVDAEVVVKKDEDGE
jgi:hypothetical protein